MYFSTSTSNNGGKAGKFMLIAGLHVALGTLFVQGMHTRHISLPSLPQQVLVMIEPQRVPPPPPPPAPNPPQQLAPPQLVVPPVDVEVAPPPVQPPLQAVVQADAPPVDAARVAPEAPPAARPGVNSAQMHSAVFADASGCALPDYPSSAARNGETGVTTLALLVGTDGRVSSARVQQSSGSKVLDRAALNALSLCKFKPATSNGVAEAGWAQLAYVWKLD